MIPARRPRSRLRSLRLLPAVAFAIALALTLTAGDASASLSPDEHAAACHCGVKCRREACCCGPRKKAEPPPAIDPEPSPPPSPDFAPEPEPRDGSSGPCLAVDPGGDEVAPPVKLAPVGVGDAAGAGLEALSAAGRRDRLPPPSSDRAEPADGSRLDRPPRADPSA
ncbi:hypothetical protein [Paludisphaera sp.]|uniref:hypothetical protein n=1 Tax=Paludisphaera sp. TaxID=2017432 RepID=UPI00301C94C7